MGRFGGGRIVIALVLALLVAGGTWFSAEQQEVPVTGRSQRVGLSDAEQERHGLQVYDQTLQEAQQRVVRSGPQLAMVQRVAKRVVAVAGKDQPEFEWQVALVDSPEVNAFCLPGGKIVVYTGILPVAGSDAGLATVMGHEVAHAIAEHGAERVLREQVSNTAVSVAAGGIAQDAGQYQQIAALLGAGAQVGLKLPWGRKQETEADQIGLIYMARAGYDPRASVDFWRRMAKVGGGKGGPEYLSTHPSEQRRVRDLQGWLPGALEEYESR